MNSWHFTPVSVIYFLAFAISLILSVLGLRIKSVKGTRLFTTVMIGVSIWILATILGLFSYDESWKMLMLKAEYIGMSIAVYFWLVFIAIYTQIDRWLNKYAYIAMAVIPLLTLITVFQAPQGSLLHTSFNYIEVKGLTTLEKNYGPVFYMWAAYAYLMLIVGFVLIIFKIFQTTKNNRKQLFYILPVVFLIIIPNTFFITDNNPIEPYDPTPLMLVIVGFLFLLTMYFYDFLSVQPIAQQLIFNNMKGGVIVVDNKDRILDINEISKTIINKSKKQVVGKKLLEILPELRDIFLKMTKLEDYTTEISLGDEKKVYELKISKLIDETSYKRGYVLIFWDITDQKMVMLELDAYARTVAHDLKNPLGNIMGCAELLKDPEIISGNKKDEYIEGIISGGERMSDIIDGLLMLAKIRNLEMIKKSPIDMKTVIDSVLTRIKDTISQKKVTVYLPEYWHDAIGNRMWIEEVWINLFSNAIKYGGNPPVINLGSNIINGMVKFWISDNGYGLSEKEQKQIFSEFSRLHPEKEKIKGHGLGLSIAQRIIKKQGGEVGVTSEINKGSTFYFTLHSV